MGWPRDEDRYKARAIAKWSLLPSVSHQAVSEGQWQQYFEERVAIELDGFDANSEAAHGDSGAPDPRAKEIVDSTRARVEDSLHDAGMSEEQYGKSLDSLVYLLPFTGTSDGGDPKTITMATVLYSPYATVNSVTLLCEFHHKDNVTTVRCEQSDRTIIPLVEVHKNDTETRIKRLASRETLTRIKYFLFGDHVPQLTPWRMFDLLFGAAAINEMGEDLIWVTKNAAREYIIHNEDLYDSGSYT